MSREINTDEKGKSLEKAVLAIEELIASTEGMANVARFAVNYRTTVNGVEYEIDVYKVVPGIETEIKILYECKNWDSTKINAKEIVYFAEKIKDLSAEKGYFVGTNYTPSAINKASQYTNLELLNLKVNLDIKKSPYVTFIISKSKSVIRNATFFSGEAVIFVGENPSITIDDHVKIYSVVEATMLNALMSKVDLGCKHPELDQLEYEFNNELVSFNNLTLNEQKITHAIVNAKLVILVNPEILLVDYHVPGRGRYVRTKTIFDDSSWLQSIDWSITSHD